MSHTQGKLATNADRIESEKEHGWANDGWIIAKCEGPDAFANTRRLVACWNALEGVPTEWLENYVFRSVENVIQENAALKAENEKLREAIQNFLDTCEATNPLINGPTFVAIDALHAVMEGK